MREHTYSVKISNLIKEFLSMDDWHYSFDDRNGTFQFGLNISTRIKNIKYLVDVDEDSFIVYAYCPIGVDTDNTEIMHRMSDFVCRANYGLKNGNFELDMRDGEIRYKCYADCENTLPRLRLSGQAFIARPLCLKDMGLALLRLFLIIQQHKPPSLNQKETSAAVLIMMPHKHRVQKQRLS